MIFLTANPFGCEGDNALRLKSYHGKYITVNENGTVTADEVKRGPPINVEILDQNMIALKALGSDGKYLHAQDENDGYRINVQKSRVGPWEKFVVEDHLNGKVALKTVHGRYFVAEMDGRLIADSRKVDDLEKFSVECVPITHANGRFNKMRSCSIK